MRSNVLLTAVAVLCCGAGRTFPQEPPQNLTPLKVELTLSRPPGGDGSRVSYTLYVLADNPPATQLRIGREVPVPVSSKIGDGATAFQYRNVGMNVTCRAFRDEKGFRVQLNLERSSLIEEGPPAGPAGYPSFQTFNTDAVFLLGDGQRAQVVNGSDPAFGGWNVEAKLEVLK